MWSHVGMTRRHRSVGGQPWWSCNERLCCNCQVALDNYMLLQHQSIFVENHKESSASVWVFAEFSMLWCKGAQYLLRCSLSPSESTGASLCVPWEAATTQCDIHLARVRGIMMHFNSWGFIRECLLYCVFDFRLSELGRTGCRLPWLRESHTQLIYPWYSGESVAKQPWCSSVFC